MEREYAETLPGISRRMSFVNKAEGQQIIVGKVDIAVDKASTTADENCVDCPTE